MALKLTPLVLALTGAVAVLAAPAQAQEAAPAAVPTGDAPPPVSSPAGTKRIFTPADFTRFACRSSSKLGPHAGARRYSARPGSRFSQRRCSQ